MAGWALALILCQCPVFTACSESHRVDAVDPAPGGDENGDGEDSGDGDPSTPGDGGDPAPEPFELTCEIPFYEHTYFTRNYDDRPGLDSDGIHNWTDPGVVLSVYLYVEQPGEMDLALYGRAELSPRLTVTAAGKTFTVTVDNATDDIIPIGRISVAAAGYLHVDIKGLSCIRNVGEYESLLAGGPATEGGFKAMSVGRDPSVHMDYIAPEGEDIRWFYNEVTVPEGYDVLHTFYMSNSFNAGYMGMQVNSTDINQRRILFSVWSEYQTDDPEMIPDAYRVTLLRRGEGVHVGDFGAEGAGKQSYLLYPWEAGRTYRFLTEVVPHGTEHTEFTAYFCGHDGKWRLIASFMQPIPGKDFETHYEYFSSFLETYHSNYGYLEKKVYLDNQWVQTVDGRWIEICEGVFAFDPEHPRRDFEGGVEDGRFYLRHCGYFDDAKIPTPGTRFRRPARGVPPTIDLEALEKIPSAD